MLNGFRNMNMNREHQMEDRPGKLETTFAGLDAMSYWVSESTQVAILASSLSDLLR